MVWNDEEVHCMQLSRSKTGIGYWGRVDKWGGNMGGSAQQQQGWSGLEREGAFWEYVGEMVVESLNCPTPGEVGGVLLEPSAEQWVGVGWALPEG